MKVQNDERAGKNSICFMLGMARNSLIMLRVALRLNTRNGGNLCLLFSKWVFVILMRQWF